MEHASPLVSVLLPVYNDLLFLREAVASVLAQTYTNIELIIVDDGSNQKTKDLIAQIATLDARFVALRPPQRPPYLRNPHFHL